MPRLPLAAALLAAALAAPAAAQVAPAGSSAAIAIQQFDETAVSPNDRILPESAASADGAFVDDRANMTIRPFRSRGGELGAYVGGAEENATAYRGPYDFGQCPSGTLLTPFGTCARR